MASDAQRVHDVAELDYVLSPDRRQLTVTKVVGGVRATYVLGWAFDPSDELVAATIERIRDLPLSDGDAAGQKVRWRKLGPIGIEVESGPPTWLLPRVQMDRVKRWSLRIGWLRFALCIWRFGATDDRTARTEMER